MNNEEYIENLIKEIETFNKYLEIRAGGIMPNTVDNATVEEIEKSNSLYESTIEIVKYYSYMKKKLDNIHKLYENTSEMLFLITSNCQFYRVDKLTNAVRNYYHILINNNVKFNRATIPYMILYGEEKEIPILTETILKSIKYIPLCQEEKNQIITKWLNFNISYKIYKNKRPVNIKFINKSLENLYNEIKMFTQLQYKKLEDLSIKLDEGDFFDKEKFIYLFNKVNDIIQDYTKAKKYTNYVSIFFEAISDIPLCASNIDSTLYNDNILKGNLQKYYEMLFDKEIPFNRGIIPYSLFYENKVFLEKLNCNINSRPLTDNEFNSIFYFWLYGELDFENIA